jgi:three-Cys-motif partner protein
MAVPEAYRGREQTFVKHTLLRKYLDRLGHKIGHSWDCISYVDCFAGPWESSEPNFADTSFGIAVDVLSKAQRDIEDLGRKRLRLRFCFVESDKRSFLKPKEYADLRRREALDIVPLEGEFEDQLQQVQLFLSAGGHKTFRFLLIDPKGWTGFALNKIAPLIECRSAEILVNVMTSHIRRFVTKEAHAEQFEQLFGENMVATEASQLVGGEREQFLVRKYAQNLKSRARLSYTSTAAVFRAEQDAVHYYLVFGTNSPHGVQVFKEAEQTAFEIGESAREEAKSRKHINRTGQTEFAIDSESSKSVSPVARTLRASYLKQAKETLRVLALSGQPIGYDELLGTVLQTPLVWKTDFDEWILELAAARRVSIIPSLGRKKLRLSQNYRIVAVQ